MIELPIQRVEKIYFKLIYSSMTRRDIERENGAGKANWVKLKGTMTKKPVQKKHSITRKSSIRRNEHLT